MSKKGFESPNHTQVPNDLFDVHLPVLGHAELKVLLIIVRQTLGWHRRKSHVSQSFIEEATGLSRTAVQEACKKLADCDLLERTKDKEGYEWEIIWNDPPHIGGKGGQVSGLEQLFGGQVSGPGGPSKQASSTQEGGQVSGPKEIKKERTTKKEDDLSVLKEKDDRFPHEEWQQVLAFIKNDRYPKAHHLPDGEFLQFWENTHYAGRRDGKYLIACENESQKERFGLMSKIAEHYLFGVMQEHVEVEFVWDPLRKLRKHNED